MKGLHIFLNTFTNSHKDVMFVSLGAVDSSGIEFYYTSTRREFDAGVLLVGHVVDFSEIIPPNAIDYKIFGECNSACTDKVQIDMDLLYYAKTLHLPIELV